MRFTLAVVVLAALLPAGCGDYDPLDQPRRRSAAPEAVGVAVDPFSMGEPVNKAAQQKAPPDSDTAKEAPGARRSRTAEPNRTKQSAAQRGPGDVPEGMVREKAAAGAGKKGRYGLGVITAPLSAYWRVQERVAYEMQVKHSLDLYQAQHGSFPKTQKEFEEQILIPNQVKLPELPTGHRYVYDPEKGELMVERPE